ncbi:hypothetical protein Trydic_g1399 [Trypoxylus dichotomus]
MLRKIAFFASRNNPQFSLHLRPLPPPKSFFDPSNFTSNTCKNLLIKSGSACTDLSVHPLRASFRQSSFFLNIDDVKEKESIINHEGAADCKPANRLEGTAKVKKDASAWKRSRGEEQEDAAAAIAGCNEIEL